MKTLFTGSLVKLKLFIKKKIIFLKAHFILNLEDILDVGLHTHNKNSYENLKNLCVHDFKVIHLLYLQPTEHKS